MQGDNQPFAERLRERQSQRPAAGKLRVDDIGGGADIEPRDEPEVAKQQSLERPRAWPSPNRATVPPSVAASGMT